MVTDFEIYWIILGHHERTKANPFWKSQTYMEQGLKIIYYDQEHLSERELK
jgi:hypothetical protein